MNRSNPWLAFVLNFALPGVGLMYLGQWKRGILNLVLVQATICFLFFGFAEPTLVEQIHYVFLALAAASGGYAHGVSQSLNHAADAKLPGKTESAAG